MQSITNGRAFQGRGGPQIYRDQAYTGAAESAISDLKMAIFRKVKADKHLRGDVQVVRRTSKCAGQRGDCGKVPF